MITTNHWTFLANFKIYLNETNFDQTKICPILIINGGNKLGYYMISKNKYLINFQSLTLF